MKIQEKSFVAMADDSLLLEKGLVPYDTVVRHCYFGMGELPEELRPFEEKLEDPEHITIIIPRVKDKRGRIIRLLPAFLVPYKRYSVDDIENELDETTQTTTTANEATRFWWRLWWKAFREQANELMESLANKQKGWLRRLVLAFYSHISPTFECNASWNALEVSHKEKYSL